MVDFFDAGGSHGQKLGHVSWGSFSLLTQNSKLLNSNTLTSCGKVVFQARRRWSQAILQIGHFPRIKVKCSFHLVSSDLLHYISFRQTVVQEDKQTQTRTNHEGIKCWVTEKLWHKRGQSWKSYWIIQFISMFLYSCSFFCVLGIRTISHRETQRAQSLTLNIIYCRWKTDQHFPLTPAAQAGFGAEGVYSFKSGRVCPVSLDFSCALFYTYTLQHQIFHLLYHSYSRSFIQAIEKIL